MKEEALWSMYCPVKYSGVAPMLSCSVKDHLAQQYSGRLEKQGRAITDWDRRVVDLKPDSGPLGERIEVDTSANESLGQLPSLGFKGVGPDGQRTGRFIGFKELHCLP